MEQFVLACTVYWERGRRKKKEKEERAEKKAEINISPVTDARPHRDGGTVHWANRNRQDGDLLKVRRCASSTSASFLSCAYFRRALLLHQLPDSSL